MHRIFPLSGGVVMGQHQAVRPNRLLGEGEMRSECRNPQELLPACFQQIVEGRLMGLSPIGHTDTWDRMVLDDVLDVVSVRGLVVGFVGTGQQGEGKSKGEISEHQDENRQTRREPREMPGSPCRHLSPGFPRCRHVLHVSHHLAVRGATAERCPTLTANSPDAPHPPTVRLTYGHLGVSGIGVTKDNPTSSAEKSTVPIGQSDSRPRPWCPTERC